MTTNYEEIVREGIEIAIGKGRALGDADLVQAAVLNPELLTPEQHRYVMSQYGKLIAFFASIERAYAKNQDLSGETCPKCHFDKNYCICGISTL